MNIKKATVAGTFYPDNKDEIINLIEQYDKSIENDTNYLSKLVISPHAGYKYSGFGAYLSLKHLGGKNIFILAPAHKEYVEGVAICDYDYFETPMGRIPVNKNIINDLATKYNLNTNNTAFEHEHAIEVQLPFLSYLKKEFNIVPILVGNCNPNLITEIIEEYYKYVDNTFIISSDLTHFLTDEKAKKIDAITAQMIENNNNEGLQRMQACNAVTLYSAIEFSKNNNYSFIRLDMRNSSLTTKDTKNVVGYGSWMLYEGTTNSFIKKYYSQYLKKICYNSIKNKGNYLPENIPPVLNQIGASFVTIEKQGVLRGCIGTISAHRELIEDIVNNAYNSAYKDPRFQPVKEQEINELDINISLLTRPFEITFSDEEDLLNKIVPYKDGLIISDLGKRAVYLPSVWEQLPDKKIFLCSLKQKAGLKPDHFSKSFRAYKFYSEYI